MADYQLTQTGNEVQDLLDNIPIGKFRLLSAPNSTELDDIPSTNAEWICGVFDTLWANRPCDYGLCYRMTAPTQQWSYEIAHEAGNSPTIYYRASTNGYAWTSWTSFQPALTYTTFVSLLSTIPAQPTNATTASYTVPNNGWVYMYATRGSTAGNTLYINVNGNNYYYFPAYDAYAVVAIIIPVVKGQVLKFTTDSASATWTIRELRYMR